MPGEPGTAFRDRKAVLRSCLPHWPVMGLTRWPHSLKPMDPETTTPSPAEDVALPFDELSPEHAGLLASWKTGDQTVTKPAAKAAAAATAEEAEADDPEENQDEEDENADDDAADENADDSEIPAEEGESEEEEGEAEEQGEEEPETEPADKSKVQKRIDTLTAQKKDLQGQLTAAQAELTTLKSGGAKPGQPIALVPLPEDPLSHLTAPEDVDAELDRARKALAWCKANRNGGTVPKAGGSSEVQELSAEEVEAIRDEQEAILEHAPRRKDWIRAYQQSNAEARKAWPDLFQSADAKAFVAEMIKQVPGLARHPHHEMIIGDALAGAQLRTGKLKAVAVGKKPLPASASKTAPSSPRPALSGSAAAPSSLPRGAKPDTAAMRGKVMSGELDGDEAVEAMLAAKFG